MTEKHYGLLGFPLSHSFSSEYFKTKFKNEGLPHSYENMEIEDLTGIRERVLKLDGFNVTIPHKEAIIEHLDGMDPVAKRINAVNVVKVVDNMLLGYNSDYLGFMNSIQPLMPESSLNRALVLGSGGASQAVIFALAKMNTNYTVISRKGTNNYKILNKEFLEHFNIIINTTPLGSYPEIETFPEIPYEHLSDKHLLYDLVYNPEKSLFLQKGEAQGCRIKNGYEMLEIQAELSWEIWNRKE